MRPGNCSGSYSAPPRASAIACKSSSCPSEVDATTFSILIFALYGIGAVGAAESVESRALSLFFTMETPPVGPAAKALKGYLRVYKSPYKESAQAAAKSNLAGDLPVLDGPEAHVRPGPREEARVEHAWKTAA